MSEEHGYQRSGKKCREKFENLYKYYKKTKEGKAGRQDGKHYRFFRQLEALYGDNTLNQTSSNPETHYASNNNTLQFHSLTNTASTPQEPFQSQKLCDSLSLSNSSGFDTCSSEENDDHSNATLVENDQSIEKRKLLKRRSGRSWKAKIKEFIDVQMRKLMERQEAWLEKLTKTIEEKEQERVVREEAWRKQEADRIDREHKFWEKERAWIEARDVALMEALNNLSSSSSGGGSKLKASSSPDNVSESIKEKWDGTMNGSNYVRKAKEGNNKKRKENSRSSCGYFGNNDCLSLYSQGGVYCEQGQESNVRLQGNDGSSPSNSNVGNVVSENCFRFLMADGENLWENYGLKLSKGENQ